MTKRISIFIASIVLGTSLLGSVAYAAVPTSDSAIIAAIPTETAQSATEDGDRPERDRDRHHRRFCAKLDQVLSRLVDQNVITREQKLRIMTAFDCVPDRPTTTSPTAARPTVAR